MRLKTMNQFSKDNIRNYNSVLKSDIHLNTIYNINNTMAYQDQIATKELRDLLTQEELTELRRLNGFPLVAVWKKSKAQTDPSGFSGYYPLNSPISDDLVPHRTEDHELDILRDFCTGG